MIAMTTYHAPQQYGLPLVGISSCLTGLKVRYDGQHKLQVGLQATLAPHVRLLPLCPESMAGMGIPRPPVNLIQVGDEVRAVGRDDPHRDVTARLRSMGEIVARSYPELRGYILQSRSPSCGFGTTPLYDAGQNEILGTTNGLFVAALLAAFPGLPILQDYQLGDGQPSEGLLDRFLQQVRAYQPPPR